MDCFAAETTFRLLFEYEALRVAVKHWRERCSRVRILDQREKFRFSECHGGC
jgi:hypothetical protein